MKLINSFALSCFFFSISALAAQELVINNSALHIIFADGTEANVSSCSDFISLNQAGMKIKSYRICQTLITSRRIWSSANA